MFGLDEHIIYEIISVFEDYLSIEKATIFGSRALGNYKPGSDIDIALYGSNLTINDCLKISAKLNESLPIPYHFDIVNYLTLKNLSLKFHIDTEGKILYERKYLSMSTALFLP